MADLFELFERIKSGNKSDASNLPVTHIVCGLGNPGEKYTFTRHNAGFMALDYLSEKYNIRINKAKYKALICDKVVFGKRVLFVKPQTFMNLSGEAVKEAADFYKIPSENIIVIFDDISLEVGKMRIKRKGSAGGHNGIKSIIANLGTDVFPRIKVGVGYPENPDEMIDWVLGRIPKEEQDIFFAVLERIPGALELILDFQIDKAMNTYN